MFIQETLFPDALMRQLNHAMKGNHVYLEPLEEMSRRFSLPNGQSPINLTLAFGNISSATEN